MEDKNKTYDILEESRKKTEELEKSAVERYEATQKIFKEFDEVFKNEELAKSMAQTMERHNKIKHEKLPTLEDPKNHVSFFNESINSSSDASYNDLLKQFMDVELDILNSLIGKNLFKVTENEKNELREMVEQQKSLEQKMNDAIFFKKRYKEQMEQLRGKITTKASEMQERYRNVNKERVKKRDELLKKVIEKASKDEVRYLNDKFLNYLLQFEQEGKNKYNELKDISHLSIDQALELVMTEPKIQEDEENKKISLKSEISRITAQKEECKDVTMKMQGYIIERFNSKGNEPKSATRDDDKVQISSNKTTNIVNQVTKNMQDVERIELEQNIFKALEDRQKNNNKKILTDEEINNIL